MKRADRREGDRVEGGDSSEKLDGTWDGGRAGAPQTQKASTGGGGVLCTGGDQKEVGGRGQMRPGLEGECEEEAYGALGRGEYDLIRIVLCGGRFRREQEGKGGQFHILINQMLSI